MNFFKKILLASTLMLLFAVGHANAQFYNIGTDPYGKWYERETGHYRLIYPSGMDSLCISYANALEKYYHAVGRSSGYLPCGNKKQKLPVILHPWNAMANGSVTWAPRRMDLYTMPDPYVPEPFPWTDNLAVHESRHVSQMQFAYDGKLKFLSYIFGEMAPGALSGIYPSTHLLEGDAVVAETGLSQSGRGRSANFLAYYMAATDAGDQRDWYTWRYGSYRHFTPDHYALGYLTIAGMRTLYGDSLFTKRYFRNVSQHPLRLLNLHKTVKEGSGKSFQRSFDEIMSSEYTRWQKDAEGRKPYIHSEIITKDTSWFFSYTGTVSEGGYLYAVRSGLSRENELVRISPDGEIKVLKPFSYYCSRLTASKGRIWWSESTPSIRRELEMFSDIRYISLDDNKIHRLTHSCRYFNPIPSSDGKTVTVTEYPASGGSAIVILDASTGSVLRTITSPDNIQIVETAWVADDLYASGISEAGFSIYRIDENDSLHDILGGGQNVSISHLGEHNGELAFVSDMSGVNEIYSIGKSGGLKRLTSTRYGSSDWAFIGDTLYFSSLTDKGKLLCKADQESLIHKQVSFNNIHRYTTADILSRQEEHLASAAMPADDSCSISAPKRYFKGLHLPNFHSWVPAYINPDAVNAMSIDKIASNAGIGATAFVQDRLGTIHGSVAYKWGQSTIGRGWRHSLHANLTYEGFFPVIDIKFHYSERQAIQYFRRSLVKGEERQHRTTYTMLDVPYLDGDINVYIPLNFSSGGWNRGLIPSVRWSFSNDRYSKSDVVLSYDGDFGGYSSPGSFAGYRYGDNAYIQSIDCSLRGYTMTYTPTSAVYPRLGVAAEIGYSSRLSLSELYTSNLYLYSYGYLPGFMPCQGLRWTASYQRHLGGDRLGQNKLLMRPRGFAGTETDSILGLYAPSQTKFTADYAIPIWVGDFRGLSPLAYLRNIIIKPHADITFAGLTDGIGRGNLWSIGSEFDFKLGNLLWFPYETTIGLTYSYNGGSFYNLFSKADYSIGRNYFGLVFSVAL